MRFAHPQKLIDACLNGMTAEAERLIEEGAPVDWQDGSGRAPLHYASARGYTEIVMLLLENKCNINITTNDGNTPLIWAACWDKMDTVRALVKEGCDITFRGVRNKTAAEWAKESGHHALAEYLSNQTPLEQVRLASRVCDAMTRFPTRLFSTWL